MNDWLIHDNAKLKNHHDAQSQEQQRRKKRSIYKVIPFFSNLNKKAYQPQAVSFGPYHHGKPHLKPMKDHKECVLLHLLQRTQVSLDRIVDSIVNVAQELKDSYDSLEGEWQDNIDKFVKIIIMDGCFMLELLRAVYQPENYYCIEDPVFIQQGDIYVMPLIRIICC